MSHARLMTIAALGALFATATPAYGADNGFEQSMRGGGGGERDRSANIQGVITQLGATTWRIGPAVRQSSPLDKWMAMVPEPLRPLMDRKGNNNARLKPNGTSQFEPSSLVPLLRAQDGRELGVAWGRAGKGRASVSDQDRATVVVIYVGMRL